MIPLIVQFGDAAPADYCKRLIQRFEDAPEKSVGRTGASVDKGRKDSSDLYLSTLPSWMEDCRNINNMVYQGLVGVPISNDRYILTSWVMYRPRMSCIATRRSKRPVRLNNNKN